MQLIEIDVVGLLCILMPFTNAVQVTFDLDSSAYFSTGDLILTCRVDQDVNINSATFRRDQITQIGIYDPTTTCTPTKFFPTDLHNYSTSCVGLRNLTLTKYGVNKTEEQGRVWQCTFISNPGGPCISTSPCVSPNITVPLETTTTSTTTPSTTTKETVTSTSSPSTSTSSTTIKVATNSTSVNPAATGSTATASINTAGSAASASSSTTASKSPAAGTTANATFSTSTPTGLTANATINTSTPTGLTANATINTSTPTGSTANATINTSTPTNYATTGSTSTSPTKSNSSQGGDDTKVIVLAVVVPIGGLLLIGLIILVLCIRHRRSGKNDHEIPDAAQNRSNNVDGFKHDRTAKQLNAIQTTSDDYIIYPGPAAMSTTSPNKNKKHHIITDQYQTSYTGTYGYQAAYVPSSYTSDRSYTKHHNVGHPYSRPYTGTYGYQNAYGPSTYMSTRTYPSNNKSYDYEPSYRIADSRPAYDQATYYPQTGHYGQSSQDVYYRGGGQYSYGHRSRSHLERSGRKQQREYYNQYEMADYGGSRTRCGQTKQYGQNAAFYY